ncbi:hypothetical protein GWI33_021130 [Rhynchophorus ferrugineus]|uniref:Uncharacterized protein n=1 Tax=Rhynchophorus ferrugineus TaxID=354439 RepID=A0A834HT69_RHYFE|nr:hypothetical protein GWI33_021130 [Rhynchophorus ferrugineus]
MALSLPDPTTKHYCCRRHLHPVPTRRIPLSEPSSLHYCLGRQNNPRHGTHTLPPDRCRRLVVAPRRDDVTVRADVAIVGSVTEPARKRQKNTKKTHNRRGTDSRSLPTPIEICFSPCLFVSVFFRNTKKE